MIRLHFSMTTILLGLATLAVAAPVPAESKTPISAENADQVSAITDFPKRANTIRPGSKPGELVLVDWNGGAEVVDDTNFRTILTLAKNAKPSDLALSPDGKLAAWTEPNRTSYTVQETDGGKSFEIEIGKMPCDVAFTPDGKHLAIGYLYSKPRSEGEGYSEIRLFDVKGKFIRAFEQNGYGATKPVFSTDGKLLAVSNRNCGTQIFDVATGKLLHFFEKRMTQEVAFSPDGKMLAAGYVDGTVAVYDVANGKLLKSEASGCKEIYSVAWNPKGDVLASSGREGKIVLWEPGTLKKLKELDAPFWVIQVRFTADGTRLLTSSAADWSAKTDRKIAVWAIPKGKR